MKMGAVKTSVIISAIVAIQLVLIAECGSSRQEQEILLLDALSRKYSQNSGPSNNQFEPNSIMDMLGRSTNLLNTVFG